LSFYLLLALSLIASNLKPPAAEGLFALLRIKKAESHYANASRLFLKETVPCLSCGDRLICVNQFISFRASVFPSVRLED
jgi:hypothetical protein